MQKLLEALKTYMRNAQLTGFVQFTVTEVYMFYAVHHLRLHISIVLCSSIIKNESYAGSIYISEMYFIYIDV